MVRLSRERRAARPLAVQVMAAGLVALLVRPPAAQAASDKLLPHLVLGATGPRVAVFVVSLDPKAKQHASELEQAAERATEKTERLELVPAQDAANPTFARARAEKLEQAAEKVKQGKAHLDELEALKAVEVFTEAVALLKDADSTRDMGALLDAWLLKAAAHATGGENGPAKKDIEAIVPLDPKAEFSSSFFSPDLIKFAEAQRKLAENAKGEITVRTEPPGARVWVDGQYRGTSPVLVAGLSAGRHLVAATAQGFALTQVELPPGEHLVKLEPAEMAPALKQASARVTADPEGPGRDAAVRDLGRAMKVEQVLLVVARKSPAGELLEVIALRLETRDGHNAGFRQGVLKVGDEGAMTEFFDGLLKREDKRDGKSPRTHFKDSGSSVKTTIGISLVGAGVAAAATGAVFGVMALNQSSQFKDTPQTQVTKSQHLASSGRTYAWVADISFILAGVAAIAGGALILTDKAESGDELSAAPQGRRGLDPKAVEEQRRRALEQEKRDAARRAEERRKEEEERERRKREETEKPEKAPEDDAKVKEEEARNKAEAEDAEKARAAEEEKKKKDDEDEKDEKDKKDKKKKKTKKELKEEERARKEEEKRAKEEAKKQAAEEAAAKQQAAEEEARKKAAAEEEERKKKEAAEKKRKQAEEEDLRNF
ncbi:MAG: PEGA domain-containing protein [Myxococcales bacterium]|nr:PEGA domain-containing protein [Myxococcales bacterium]